MSIKPDRIIRSRRKTISLVIDSDARVTVRAPLHTPENTIHKLVSERKDWIEDKLTRIRKRLEERVVRHFEDGEVLPFAGENLILSWYAGPGLIRRENRLLRVPDKYRGDAPQILERWYRREALKLFRERVDLYSRYYLFHPGPVKLSSAVKRWGSCGPTNSINLNWRLIMAPLAVIDYVVVHELCHTVFRNHSPRFWSRVGVIMPDYPKHRQWLRDHHEALTWETV
jgi:predicted metal-dependent hydrolase